MNQLQSLIQFNEEMLEGTGENVLAELHAEDTRETGPVTDQLLADETTVCWTCGTKVETQQIETTLDRLRELRKEKLDTVDAIETELGDLKQRRTDIEDEQRQRKQLRRELNELQEDRQRAEVHIEEPKTRQDELTEQIDALEADVEELEDDTYSEILDLRKEVNQIEFELDKLEGEHDDLNEEIATIEERLEQRDRLDEQRTAIQTELEDLRTRIERIEDEAIEAFNEHMDTILNILNYENLERIWLERRQQDVREGRRKVTKTIFELHVIRTTGAGTAYEDTIEHLSESEREITGLVFALAGYLAHDVHETVPFMLLDSLEVVDADRLATLIDHFRQYADYLVVALLPEDAAALDDEYQRVTNI